MLTGYERLESSLKNSWASSSSSTDGAPEASTSVRPLGVVRNGTCTRGSSGGRCDVESPGFCWTTSTESLDIMPWSLGLFVIEFALVSPLLLLFFAVADDSCLGVPEEYGGTSTIRAFPRSMGDEGVWGREPVSEEEGLECSTGLVCMSAACERFLGFCGSTNFLL